MHVWTNVTAVREAAPSPLLIHLAGEYADRIALAWPAPHTPFLTASTGQRHLVAMALSHGSVDADLRGLLTLPLKRGLRSVLPMAPAGLPRALSHLGESLWSPADYSRLLRVLQRPEAAKVIAHAALIDPRLVAHLERVPAPLLAAGRGRLALTRDQTVLLAESFAIVEGREGPAAARQVADRWAAAKSVGSLFERVALDIQPDLPAPPFPGGGRLRPLATKAAVRDAGRRFRNCLADQISRAVDGTVAFYEWSGPPAVAVEIIRDNLFGWTLSEAKVARNDPVPADARPRLIADLREMGVNVGRSGWELHNALRRANQPDFAMTPLEESIGYCFGD